MLALEATTTTRNISLRQQNDVAKFFEVNFESALTDFNLVVHAWGDLRSTAVDHRPADAGVLVVVDIKAGVKAGAGHVPGGPQEGW